MNDLLLNYIKQINEKLIQVLVPSDIKSVPRAIQSVPSAIQSVPSYIQRYNEELRENPADCG